MIFGFNPESCRKDFAILSKPIIYFDNACMSLKPKQVVEKMLEYYNEYTACGGRSAHRFAARVEDEVLNARNEVRDFINAKDASEIIFTRNTTEGINLVANSFGLKEGDEVILSDKEHNSNLLPFLKLSKKGIKLKFVDSNRDNSFNLEKFEDCLSEKTKLVSVVYVSNIDGVANPIPEIVKLAHKNGAKVLADGAQAVPSIPVDVRKLNVDFLAFSGHKMLGPTGTGILYGKKPLLEQMDQFIIGGETVVDSSYDRYTMEGLPMKFEAGLQNYAGIIGLGEAVRYLKKVGIKRIHEHEIDLNKIITDSLSPNAKISIIGPTEAERRSGIFSFNIMGLDPLDVSKILDVSRGILTRGGTHCVHSWFNKHNLKGSVRASLYLYNTEEEAKIFAEEVKKIAKI